VKILPLKLFYILTDIKEHQQHKNILLSLIDKMEQSKINDGKDIISKTDWSLPHNIKREYISFFYSMIKPYMNIMANKLKCKSWDISNTWYQTYKKGDTHSWHIHPEVNYTNVYYVDLPDEAIKTQIYDIVEDKILDEIQVKEGQLFTFPANIIHRSPINTSDKSKTIISFNSNFRNLTELIL